jgi:hypothetical protein
VSKWLVPNNSSPFALLIYAALIAAVSFSFGFLPDSIPELTAIGLIYLGGLLGLYSMLLCREAHSRASNKRSILLYSILLAPFAFGLPTWWLYFLGVLLSGHYHGPMP